MRKSFLLLFVLLLGLAGKSTHIIGGEIFYRFVSKNPDNTFTYTVTVKLYRDCLNSGVNFPPTVPLNIYNTATNTNSGLATILNKTQESDVFTSNTISCISNPDNVCYKVAYYSGDIVLPFSREGYTLYTSSCCRVLSLSNVNNATGALGATYTTNIPPHDQFEQNSSAYALGDSVKVICLGKPVRFKFDIRDPDGDSLVYSFCPALNGSTTGPPPAPPFQNIPYSNGFSGTNPLGGGPPALTIDPVTGYITGMVINSGEYVVAICVTEYRNGVEINKFTKEFQFNSSSCDEILTSDFINCKDLSITFTHGNDATLKYFWDFGVLPLSTDTSSQVIPTYLYPDSGSYRVKMRVQRGPGCTDSFYSQVKLYPRMDAGFNLPPAPICSGGLLNFTNTSTSSYGLINSWTWTNPLTGQLLSNLPSPAINYPAPGSQTLQLLITSDKGCRDSIQKTFLLDQGPTIDAGPDIGMCLGDSLQLNVNSNGSSFAWSPGLYLSSNSVQSPKVSPLANIKYEVRTFSPNGCISKDSIEVKVSPKPLARALKDTTFCFGGSTQLFATGGTRYVWTPATGLSNALAASPIARPLQTTSYTVTVTDTLACPKTDRATVTIRVIPPLQVKAGRDTFVLRGQPIQLRVTGAPAYNWSPGFLLNNANTATPLAPNLGSSQVFTVRGFTPEGCEGFDTVKVTLLEIPPDLFVPTGFSPNGDGNNDQLKPLGLGAEYVELFFVYNRWGQLVFFTREYGKGWDGRLNGVPQPEGSYSWYLVGRDFTGKSIIKKGVSLLLR